jgi:intein/homing endonuclease
VLKVSFFRGETEAGPTVVPLFNRTTDGALEKTASSLLPEVVRYIDSLRPRPDAVYNLVNAMGAGEYFGSNINGDYFPEAALMHRPDRWDGNPVIDKIRAKDWPYGFPTFYFAHPYAHHRNKDASRAFGEVELAAWNDRMKRVELVTRCDKDKCLQYGGAQVWDKLIAGMFPDVSMGCKVPYDTCFPAGTLVRTRDGQKPIEQIRVGDFVLSHTGAYREVRQMMRREAEGLVRITASGLPRIDATDNHPFLVLRREQVRTCKGSANGNRLRHSFSDSATCKRCGKAPEFELVWAAAETLKPGDYLATPVPSTRRAEYDVTPAQARLLGYYLGDGYIIRQRTGKRKDGDYRDVGFGFSVGSEETAHLQRLFRTIVEAGAANEPNVYDAGNDRKAHIVSVYDQSLAAWLQKWGGRTSHGKHLNEEVFYWSREAKLELVAGYIDTDGSFDARGQIRIASVNRGLLLDVQRLLLSEGITATVCFAGTNSSFGVNSEFWYLVLSTAQSQKFLGRSTKVTPVDVGWESPQSFFWNGYWLTPVKAVEELDGDVEVFNLSVDRDESYVAEGRAVHNCSICLDWKLYREAQATFDPKKHKHPGEAVLAFHKNKHKIRGLSITRADYCFPPGTPILLADGSTKNIEDINVGDEVLTHKGVGKPVTQLLPSRGPSVLVGIDAWGFLPVQATDNHPFLSARPRKKKAREQSLQERLDWVHAGDLQVGDIVLCPLPRLTDESPMDAAYGFLLGLYLAEGGVNFSTGVTYPKSVRFTVHGSERSLLEEAALAAKAMDPGCTEKYRAYSDKNALELRINSRRVAEWLLQHGGRGSRTKSLSPAVWQMGQAFCHQVLRGWAVGDGSYDERKGVLRVATSSLELAKQMQLLAACCGVVGSLHRYARRTNYGDQTIWYVSFSGDAALAIREGRRQQEVAQQSKLFLWNGYLATSIRKLTYEEYDGPLYNFEVEDDHSYVAGSYAVHNCDHAKKQMNRILPDGRKVFVYNDYPRFFDISFVFIGADKTAKTMMKIASGPSAFWDIGPSAEMAEKLGYSEEPSQVKTASALEDLVFEAAFGKNAKAKKSEIIKDVIPSQFAGKAIPALNAAEQDLPRDLLNLMGRGDLKGALASTGGLGIVLRPREFQRIILVQLGAPDVADELDMLGEVFPKTHERAPLKLDSKDFIPALVRLLLPFLMERSAIAPALERRLLWGITSAPKEKRGCSSLSSDLLRKIGAAYNSYRDQLMELTAHTQDLLKGVSSSSASEFRKLSSASPEEVFSPLSVEYLNRAFIDEQAEPDTKQARAGVERGFPSRNT